MEQQIAYVLHSRPYRETSALVDLFTPDFGLIRCIGRGIKKNIGRGQGLQPFNQYEIIFHGQSDLKQLDRYDSSALPILLKADALFCGFYVNEVILRALRSEASIEAQGLFNAYVDVLHSLEANVELERRLRQFELTLLEYMGQCYEWSVDFKTGGCVKADWFYGFFVEQGVTRVGQQYASKNPNLVFLGEHLIALSQNDLSDQAALQASKRLLRLALRPIIGYKPIKARELIKKFRDIGT